MLVPCTLTWETVINQPLPIYSTELSAARQAQVAADTIPVEATEPSPFATYGVLPVSFFGLSALIANEMFILNEESLLVGTWSCFLLTTYLQMGDAFSKSMQATANTLKEYVCVCVMVGSRFIVTLASFCLI